MPGSNSEFDLAWMLDSLAKRPALYAGYAKFDIVRTYLWGLSAGLMWAGIEYTWEEYLAAAESRGWDPRGSIGIERDFRKHKLSDEEMVRELLAVEVDAYKRALSRLQTPRKRRASRRRPTKRGRGPGK